MATFISHSPADTESLGEAWGREAQAGWLIALNGDLGAGKTQLVRGLARGIGCTARVHSPTFTIVNEYSGGRLLMHHLDLYRLESKEQVLAAGLEDYLVQPRGLVVVEWAGRWLDAADKHPCRCRHVSIEVTGETTRLIRYEDAGA